MKTITLKNSFSKESFILYGKIFLPGLIFLSLVGLFVQTHDLKFGFFSQDPIQTLHAKPYIGLVSNIGILFWCASASILLFSSAFSYTRKNGGKQSSFLFFTGLLSLLLMVDDLLMFHESVNEALFFGIYFISVAAIIYFYREVIENSDYVLWIIAFLLLCSSVFIDVAARAGVRLPHSSAIEDSAKFLGIITWFSYFARTSYRAVTGNNDASRNLS